MPVVTRALEAERAADRDDALADHEVLRRAELERVQRRRAGVDLQHGDVARRIGADQRGLGLVAVREADGDGARALDDVRVRDDVAVGVEHEARALGLAAPPWPNGCRSLFDDTPFTTMSTTPGSDASAIWLTVLPLCSAAGVAWTGVTGVPEESPWTSSVPTAPALSPMTSATAAVAARREPAACRRLRMGVSASRDGGAVVRRRRPSEPREAGTAL